MKNLVLLAALATSSVFAACANPHCFATIPTTSATATVNAGFSSANASQNFSVRIDNINWSGMSNFRIMNIMGYTVDYFAATPGLFFNGPDISSGYGGCIMENLSSYTDLFINFDRNVSTMQLTVGVYDGSTGLQVGTAVGGVGANCVYTLNALANNAAFISNGITFGVANATGSSGFIRLATGDYIGFPPFALATPANLLDYEWGSSPGSNADTSPASICPGVTTCQNLTGGSGNSLTYINAMTYAPICTIPQQTFLLNSTTSTANPTNACQARDGGLTLIYAWNRVVPGADGVSNLTTFSSSSSSNPTLTGGLTTPGSVNLQVCATDSVPQTACFTIHNGAVPYNSNGSVILGAGGWDLSTNAQTILGPLTAYGRNPWTFADSTTLLEIYLQLCNNGVSGYSSYCTNFNSYPAYWRSFLTGTATFHSGSTTVDFSGAANTQNTFCGGGTTATNGQLLIWQYAGSDSLTHYTQQQVATCPTTTSITLVQAYPANGTQFAPWPNAFSGASFTEADNSSLAYFTWLDSTEFPANYYDTVLGAYATYYRTGFDIAYTLAETLSLAWLEWPQLDYFSQCNSFGNNINPSGTTFCFAEPRNVAATGIILRYTLGHTELLGAIEQVWNAYTYYMSLGGNFNGYIYDMRDMGYAQHGIALCVAVDPAYVVPAGSPLAGQSCLQRLQANLSNWTAIRQGNGGFIALYGGRSSAPFDPNTTQCSSCSVTMTNGSTAVVGTNTNFCTPSCAASTHQAFISFCGTPACSPSVTPTSNATMDATLYAVDSVMDATHLTLATPYAGNTNLSGRGFAISNNNMLLGYGVQPYMEAILAQSFFMMAKVDATNSFTWNTYAHGAISDAVSNIYGDNGGLYFGTYFPGCTPPMHFAMNSGIQGCVTGTSSGYNAPATDSQSRSLALETMRALVMDQQAGYSANTATASLLMTQMWSCPGYLPVGDGNCVSDYIPPSGFFVTGNPPTGTAPRWFGFSAGFSNAAAGFLPGSGGSFFGGNIFLGGPLQVQ